MKLIVGSAKYVLVALAFSYSGSLLFAAAEFPKAYDWRHMAGEIGKQKFSYDVWGATVNFAGRMESSGAPGRINVLAAVYERVRSRYRWEIRGAQAIKVLGPAEMFFLLSKL